ncbi:nuclear transport factor 2 family protein [Peredibacter starrii]|uniref:Nuclear transport factor 2 family protein n=1 Tax=Peredibacter starrii TaxID=28202 RepID=A0AAX4HMZ4_9BACT|nr:nuclear transport factor 2 family protein [Peredibacter starrii]WPU64532.1 nuclear transport factor 2 family protein [Peredibacter starrii]
MSINNQNLNVIKALYEAINQNDIVEAMKLFDTQIERVELIDLSSVGVFRGLTEMEAHLRKGRETWAEGSCTPERFTEINNKVVVFTHVRVRLKNHADWLEGQTTDVFALSKGKITEFRTYIDRDEALKWAGVIN